MCGLEWVGEWRVGLEVEYLPGAILCLSGLLLKETDFAREMPQGFSFVKCACMGIRVSYNI